MQWHSAVTSFNIPTFVILIHRYQSESGLEEIPAGLLCGPKQEEGDLLPEKMELNILVTAEGGASEKP